MSAFSKKLVQFNDFYIVSFHKSVYLPNLLFIHGGPGLNCGLLEYLIEFKNFFSALNCNLILYDQRACGRSKNFNDSVMVTHQDNVNDLIAITKHLNVIGKAIDAFVGHSYGAKLLYEFYNLSNSGVPGVFISTANSILTPRLNNLMSDLNYLKKSYPDIYQQIIGSIYSFDLTNLWKITEELSSYFQKNTERHFLYWANLKIYESIIEIQNKLSLPINQSINLCS